MDIGEKNCINCSNFAWWDGDYCCTAKLKILQNSPDGKINDDMLMALKLNRNCNSWNEAGEKIREMHEEAFNDYLKTKE